MADHPASRGGTVDKGRRYFLIGATSAVAAAGVVGAAVPFVASWSPSAKARALGAPVRIDISRLQAGQLLGPMPAWRGKPVFVLSRTEEMLTVLESNTEDLLDPNSDRTSQQPESSRNAWRSQKPAIGVYLGLCTHLGCSPKFHPEVGATSFDGDWKGGFFCPCHGSKFDLAGRVYKGVPAPDNLEVPPYRYETDSVIVVGEGEGAA
ncbi:MAG: ubiquinol-cytochrome c reductase iron-sulfur subunit [Pseudomonadales bacterium]|nr:ubiquinol-cytochrome c reductase iron-sulfur subunit [Pseudomonadales bacterium]MCP5185367.1 ubiquinol-cytochrome c reductase iron-sulfur subunit [Pseudomonadales bacterium]